MPELLFRPKNNVTGIMTHQMMIMILRLMSAPLMKIFFVYSPKTMKNIVENLSNAQIRRISEHKMRRSFKGMLLENKGVSFSVSMWSLGLFDIFSDHHHVKFISQVARHKPPICFQDVVLLTVMTNAGYMPNSQTHDWFRNRILDHCNIPAVNAHKPAQDVAIVHRPNSSRNIWNDDVVESMMEEKLGVGVKMVVPGPWAFCDQVKLVAELDILLTPHGSQNANLLVARPGMAVIEVFHLLYYIDWYGHYLHAGRVNHYELFGTWPSSGKGAGMPLLMQIYAYLYGWKQCFFVRRCMNYGKKQQIYVDVAQLDKMLEMLVTNSTM